MNSQRESTETNRIALDPSRPIWDHFFAVAPLVVIGTREANGNDDFAPKHMATPLGWDNYFGFVCTPEHATYQNIEREKCFTVSFPKADAVVLASLAASPRCDDNSKPVLSLLPKLAAGSVDASYLEDSNIVLECTLEKIVGGFGINSLIAGRIIAASVRADAIRQMDTDDQDTLASSPLLAYISPGRYCTIDRSKAFPFPAGFQKTRGGEA